MFDVRILVWLMIGSPLSVYSQAGSEEHQAAQYLFKSFLGSVNEWSGIEYVGGPFNVDDYKEEISNYDNETRHSYYGKINPGEYGFLDSVNIVVHSGLDELVEYSWIQAMNNKEECTKTRIQFILSSLNDKLSSEAISPEAIIYNEGKISRRTGERYCRIYDCREIDPNTMQIILYRECLKDELKESLYRRQTGFSITLEKGNVKKMDMPVAGCKITPMNNEQNFVLLGDLTDREILLCIDEVRKVAIEPFICAIESVSQNNSAGEFLKYVTVFWGKAEYHLAMNSILLKKENKVWEIKQSLSVETTEPLSLCPLINEVVSFRNKIQTKDIDNYRVTLTKRYKNESTIDLTQEDWLELSEFLLRLRCIADYSEISIYKKEQDMISIDVGGIDCKTIRMKKHNNKWTLVDILRCVR
jgi:hypothetical protein